MKIGIMGGTFAPIHNGHLMLAEYAHDLFLLDEVWFLPNGHPPHKAAFTIEILLRHRLAMVKSAIGKYSYCKLCTHEAEQKKIYYSYETMEYFHQHYPDDQFYFIIGADSLFGIEKWKNVQRLLAVCTLLAACRDNKGQDDMKQQIRYLNKKYNAKIELLSTPVVPISSHEIRCFVKDGVSIKKYVPRAVDAYIREQELFKGDENGTTKSESS